MRADGLGPLAWWGEESEPAPPEGDAADAAGAADADAAS